jgi:NhaP-type Na+/H+ or K+/H+ antiporter
VIAVFVVAALAGAVVGFPVDYLRRRASRAGATAVGLLNAAALIATAAVVGATSLVSGAGAVAALVLGMVAGNLAADAAATAAWGPAKRY